MNRPPEPWPGVYRLIEQADGDARLVTYLVTHASGNVLLYPACYSEAAADAAAALGGVADVLLDHRDLLSYEEPWQWRGRFGAKLHLHRSDAPALREKVVDALFDGDFALRDDLHVVHTPGHTPSSCCVRMDRGGGVLFTSDSYTFDGKGRPKLAARRGGPPADAQARASLAKLEALPFSAVAPIVLAGPEDHFPMGEADRPGFFAALRAQLGAAR